MSEALAWGWVRHLTSGGTTTWSEWRGSQTATAHVGTQPGVLPGAQHLELLRRANLAAPGGQSNSELAQRILTERILTANAPGRGTPDLELVGVREPRRYGFDPVDPTTLPAAELLRISSWLLARQLHADDPAGAGRGVADRGAAVRAGSTWAGSTWAGSSWGVRHRHYRLLGDPLLVEPVRERLIDRGLPPGTTRLRRGRVIVHGTDLATMLADLWSWRCFLPEAGPLGPWEQWSAAAVRHRIPSRIDLAGLAQHWARSGRRTEVVVVLERAKLRRELPHRVGSRSRVPDVRRPSLAAAELARWIRPNLGLLPARTAAGRDATELMTQVLLPRLIEADSGPAPTLAPHHLGPAIRRAKDLADVLAKLQASQAHANRTGGKPVPGQPAHYRVTGAVRVIGDPRSVIPKDAADPRDRNSAEETSADKVLALSLRLLHEHHQEHEHRDNEHRDNEQMAQGGRHG